MVIGLVVEFAVRVLAKQCLSDCWGGRGLEEIETGLEGVVDVDLAVAANDVHASGPGLVSTRLMRGEEETYDPSGRGCSS